MLRTGTNVGCVDATSLVVWCGVVLGGWCWVGGVGWCGDGWCGVGWCGVGWCGVVMGGVVWCCMVLGGVGSGAWWDGNIYSRKLLWDNANRKLGSLSFRFQI